MSKYIVPIFILSVFAYGMLKNVPIYDSFVQGTKEAIKLAFNVLPFIATIFISMELMRISGFADFLSSWLAPVFECIGIPGELSKLLIMRPLSGSGSISMLDEIYMTHGIDSYISRCASVIVGCSETIFYISAVYFSTSHVKKLRYALPVALFSMIVGAIVSCLLCKIM